MPAVHLDDDSDAIVIAASGAPEAAPEITAWLTQHAKADWHVAVDGAFNVFFVFETPADAIAFQQHWGGRLV